jgi:hypothetical protein
MLVVMQYTIERACRVGLVGWLVDTRWDET